MKTIDWITIINWVISGAIGVVFGGISGWITYRHQRRLDNIAWERNLKEIKMQWEHEEEEKRKARIRDDLTRGINNSQEAIHALQAIRKIAKLDHSLSVPFFGSLFDFNDKANNETTLFESKMVGIIDRLSKNQRIAVLAFLDEFLRSFDSSQLTESQQITPLDDKSE